MNGANRHAYFHQEQDQRGQQQEHRENETRRNRERKIIFPRTHQEEHGNQDAHDNSASDAQRGGPVDHPHAPIQYLQFGDKARMLLALGLRVPVDQKPGSINDPCQPSGYDIEQAAHGNKQEHWAKRDLDCLRERFVHYKSLNRLGLSRRIHAHRLQILFDVACRLPQPVFVLHHGDADKTFAVLTIADAGSDSDFGVGQKLF
jgi:hypothetical protein